LSNNYYWNQFLEMIYPKWVIKKQITIIKIILSTNYHNYNVSSMNLNKNNFKMFVILNIFIYLCTQ